MAHARLLLRGSIQEIGIGCPMHSSVWKLDALVVEYLWDSRSRARVVVSIR